MELCSSRFQALKQRDRWRDMDIVKVIREKKAFLLLSNLLLAAFQKRIAKKMDVMPGAEMLKAIETAEAVGAGIWLADRDIRTTLSRAWHSMGWWTRIKLLSQLLLSNLLLASFQKRIARKMDVQPGAEMLKAVECADAAGAGICLADRDIRTTLSRAWHSMGWWSRVKLLSQLLLAMGQTDEITEAEIERMKQQDVLEALLSEVSQSMPALKAILIDERDQYLAEKIRRSPGRKTVAVVGAGHVPGIKAHWGAPVDLPALEQLPPPGRWAAILKWGIPGSIVALFAAGFFYGGSQAGQDMILLWSLCTGVLAGLGAALAFAHPATIVSSAIVAPFTTLHPLIAAGWISGLVEAFSRKPKVKDLESLPDDILSVRGFWRNNVTRILLVVAFVNLGASIGTLVAFPIIVRVLLGGTQ